MAKKKTEVDMTTHLQTLRMCNELSQKLELKEEELKKIKHKYHWMRILLSNYVNRETLNYYFPENF